ncbi:polyamine-transporting ATPase 13A3 isoform X2 [Phymastichus coffea]|uniref:polyamine-transporting ATPase 13A3 isoform X2 n=1 Tax=Phymastichus coffea TaxID=108790 RepID=UPI00273A9F94|nr:polyamine-transporting ATPase 13A3 isoform X2 [Phymastichus coffea]
MTRTRGEGSDARVSQPSSMDIMDGTRGNGLLHLKNGVDYVNPGEEDQMEIYGYRRNTAYTAATWFLIIISGGLLRLVFHWVPHLMLLATHSRCSLEQAETVLLLEKFQGKHTIYHVKRIKTVSAQEVWKNCQDYTEEKTERDGETEQEEETVAKSKDSRTGAWQSAASELGVEEAPMPLSFHLSGGHFKEAHLIHTFVCKKLTYIWDADRCEYLKLRGLDTGVLISTLHQMAGLSLAQQCMRRGVYGNNEIVVPVKGFFTLLGLEVLNPFYVFQLFSFCLWISDDYVYYAMVILSMSACGIVMAVLQTRRNQRSLRSTVSSSDVVNVLRDRSSGATATVPAKCLVPGDVLVIPSHGCVMPCDAVLLTGNCILNESMLTGESVPVTKTPPATGDATYDSKEHARHTLFCGTKVLQTRYYGTEKVLAVVVRTGFNTSKGGLVRSIMYPPPVDFKFEQDSYKFVELLACIASVGVIYTVITKALRGVPAGHIVLEALDLITIVVPPALPAAMTVGRLVAQSRLQKHKIYCTSPRAINVSGSIDCVCFDKTGTLTEDGLDMWGVVTVGSNKFQVPVKDISSLSLGEVLIGMVSCHSITIIDGQLIGDPLDLKMFESTGWILEEPNVSDTSKFSMLFPTIVRPAAQAQAAGPAAALDDQQLTEQARGGVEVGIVRQFPFTSSLQRMSVITRTLGADHYDLYCKGSPEMILSLSKPESVPHDFNSVLQEYTSEGYRVIALAHKSLQRLAYAKVQRITREVAEADLDFLAFVILENRLKPETTPVIGALNDAAIKVVMVTGDNMLTALSVARDCDIVKPGLPVVTVTVVTQQNQVKPQLYFTRSDTGHSNQSQSSPIAASGPCEGDLSEITDINSIVSLDTMESGGVSRQDSALNYLSDEIERCCSGKARGRRNDYAFSLTGKTWALVKQHYPELIPKITTRGTIFARMSPDQKQQLVQELQALGYYVAMVGDGANDCGALKAAHTGISLSDTESSVASPFTSRETNISCVLTVIREGRAALVTSFGIFKYMAGYSLTQFISVMLLYSIESNLTDIEFLYIDLFIISIFAFFFGKTEAYQGPLNKMPPLTSLISLTPVLSLFAQILIVCVFQYLSLWTLRQMSWFVPFGSLNVTLDKDDVRCTENYTVFIVSSIQYIILAIVFSKGRPYRKAIWTNYGLLSSFILLSAFSVYLSVGPFDWLVDWFELEIPEDRNFRYMLLAYGLANFLVAMLVEYLVIDYLVFIKLRKKMHNVEKSRRKFLLHERDMGANGEWPPLSQEPMPEAAPDILIRQSHQVTEIKIEKRVTESLPSECSVARQRSHSQQAGSPSPAPSLPPDCLLPFNNERFGGSTREVPLNPRSLCDERRNTVSMQTVLNYYDETCRGGCVKRNVTAGVSQGVTNNRTGKPRLNSESARDIAHDDKVKRIKEINPIATLPRHSAAVCAMASEERIFANDSNCRPLRDDKTNPTQNVLELDVLPS